jgi:transposase
MGHEVRLIPPAYVKAYVKRGKSDALDAEAICEAMSRPSMRFVPIKSAEQQAALMLLKTRDLLVKQRTMLSNAIRGHAAEFGVVAAKGLGRVAELLQAAAAEGVPPLALEMLRLLASQLDALDIKLKIIEVKLLAWHKQDPVSQCLATQPGIGPIGAVSFALKVTDPKAFRSARHFAAWLGLTPKENATGGRSRPGRISRQGDETLRRLLVLGATTVIQFAKPGHAAPWLIQLLARRPRKLAAVALANKMARILWAMMVSGELYRRPQPA